MKRARRLIGPTTVALVLAGLCAVATLPAAFAASSTYYVDPGGSDSNSGTSTGSPWKTLAKVNSVTFQPGDQIYFKAGGSWTGSLAPHGSGSANSPIVVDRYGSGSAPALNANLASFATVDLHNLQYWELRNLDVTNNNGANPSSGSYAGLSITAQDMGIDHHIYVKYLNIHDIPGAPGKSDFNGGIIMRVTGTTTPTAFDDILIDNNTITNAIWNGIKSSSSWDNRQGSSMAWFPSRDVQISNNYVDHVAGDGIVPEVSSHTVVENNYVQYAHNGASDYAVAMWPWSNDSATFRYNEAAFTQTTNDGEAWDMDGLNTNTLYEYNYSHDNQGDRAGVRARERLQRKPGLPLQHQPERRRCIHLPLRRVQRRQDLQQ
jgi:hypothetical protein